jgi:predicted helicase
MTYESIDLEKTREQCGAGTGRTPFQHQIEAFEALSKTFKIGAAQPAAGILELPTGAGKTFTAIRWLCNHVLPKNQKVLWLAPSFYLIDQAYRELRSNLQAIPHPRKACTFDACPATLLIREQEQSNSPTM